MKTCFDDYDKNNDIEKETCSHRNIAICYIIHFTAERKSKRYNYDQVIE